MVHKNNSSLNAASKRSSLCGGEYNSVTEGLKAIYREKIRPVESLYHFDAFGSPLLNDSDIDAKPIVLLLGQYSTGKTTFIQHLLGGEYPGSHIGPEPTTDRFIAVMHGEDRRVIQGNAAAVQHDRPFCGLSDFGTGFLNKFEVSLMPAPLLESLTFIDSPGVLSGDKQRLGRSYDFVKVCEWFASRADMILLLFDAHKLDISDELKNVMQCMRGNDEKIRIVLNKADGVSGQQLMRVYGALMWSLGKVIQTPEVMRVYIGSFLDGSSNSSKQQHYKDAGGDEWESQKRLLEAEQRDLIRDLKDLPRASAMRKINEMVKRAKFVRVHAIIISHLRGEMPAIFGKGSKQVKLVEGLADEFAKLQRTHKLPISDFPDFERFQQSLRGFDLSALPKWSSRLLAALDTVMSVDLPNLMQRFPSTPIIPPLPIVNPFTAEKGSIYHQHGGGGDDWRGRRAFEEGDGSGAIWKMSQADRDVFARKFVSLGPVLNERDLPIISGGRARDILNESNLPIEDLAQIWSLADVDCDGALSEGEFCAALHLVKVRLAGGPIPVILPDELK